MEEEGGAGDGVLVLPYPTQGHINPMLIFAGLLASRGLRPTLAVTRAALSSSRPPPEDASTISFAPLSDGLDDPAAGFTSVADYLSGLESAGSRSLETLILSHRAAGKPFTALIYDSVIRWALPIGKKLGLRCAAFSTQSCAVAAFYSHAMLAALPVPYPADGPDLSLPGLPADLRPSDLPRLVSRSDDRDVLGYLDMLVNQFIGVAGADAVLINSSSELEPEASAWLRSAFGAMTIGPVAAAAGDVRRRHSIDLEVVPESSRWYLRWLDSKGAGSVVYAAFGSSTKFGPERMAEIADALATCGKDFLWIVRASEVGKLPEGFAAGVAAAEGRGLVVSWCPQPEVLAHPAVGCFVTHCGWNSTVEALCAGVPMVAVPQSSDQPTNAKFVEDVWGVGVRAWPDDGGVIRAAELRRCIAQVMEGERSDEMRENSRRWKDVALLDGGSSSGANISDFVDCVCR